MGTGVHTCEKEKAINKNYTQWLLILSKILVGKYQIIIKILKERMYLNVCIYCLHTPFTAYSFNSIQCYVMCHTLCGGGSIWWYSVFMVCASVIIFMRSVYTIAYFDTPISTGFLKVAVSCWFFESCFASYWVSPATGEKAVIISLISLLLLPLHSLPPVSL